MMTTFVRLALVLCAGSILQDVVGDSALESALKQNDVVPDVIDEAPSDQVQVTYGDESVNSGNVLTPTGTASVPEVSYPSEPQNFYVLSMVDPDAPSRKNPTYRELLHWLVVNIPGDKVKEGEILAEYIPPAPTEGSEPHRYTFLVFKQPDGKISFSEERLSAQSLEGRTNFHIRDFAEKYQLGEPIAANFFLAEYDSHVPVVQEQLSGN